MQDGRRETALPDSTITGSARTGERDRAAGTAAGAGRREAAEVRAQEEVRTQDDQAPEDRGGQEDRIQEALETAAAVAEETGGLGTPGRPINKRSPFMIGMTAAFGVAVAYGVVELFIRARSVLIIIGLAAFIAAGLDPVVGWLVRRRIPGGLPSSSSSAAPSVWRRPFWRPRSRRSRRKPPR
jgi:hypothetical protein